MCLGACISGCIIYVAIKSHQVLFVCNCASGCASQTERESERERERRHDKRVEAEEGNVPKDKPTKRETGEYTAKQAVEKQKVK